jgi:uncharacterized membrane protein
MKRWTSALLTILATATQAAEFRGITRDTILPSDPSPVGGAFVQVQTISGDGRTLGGIVAAVTERPCAFYSGCGVAGFVWSRTDGSVRDLGTLPLPTSWTGLPESVPALSFDGQTALATYASPQQIESALHRDGMVTPLRSPIPPEGTLRATDMTSDANVVIGMVGAAPFRWSESGGFETFAGVESGSGYTPSKISNDGSTTLFSANTLFIASPEESPRRFDLQWTESGGPVELLPIEGFDASRATALSADGSVVVGTSSIFGAFPAPADRATVWTEGVPVPLAPIADYSYALDVSADGQVIVGTAGRRTGETDVFYYPEAVLWKNDTAYFLEHLLASEYGLGDELEGWHLTYATAISDDGTVIAGNGFAPDGSSAAWVVVLAVPEPASVVLALVGVIGVMAFRIKK